MCRWRHVRHLYLRCGHGESSPPVEINCESTHCKFSSNHPENCRPPHCRRRCNQYHLFPEQYTLHIDGFCSVCTRVLSRASSRRRRYSESQ